MSKANHGAKLKPCPHCGHIAELHLGRPGRGSWHWPKITCVNGHSFRFYTSIPKNDPRNRDGNIAGLIEAYNTRYDPHYVGDLI